MPTATLTLPASLDRTAIARVPIVAALLVAPLLPLLVGKSAETYRGWVWMLALASVAPLAFDRTFYVSLARSTKVLALAWAAVGIAATVFAQHYAPAVVRQAEWFAFALYTGVLVWGFTHHPDLRRSVMIALPVSFLLAAGVVAAEWFLVDDPMVHDWLRGLPLYSHIRHYGYLTLIPITIGAYPLLRPRSRPWYHVAAFVVIGIGWTVVLWTGGRGSILSCGFATFFVILLANRSRLRLAAGYLACIVVGGFVALLFDPAQPGVGIARFFTSMAPTGSLNELSTDRVWIWEQTLALWQTHPWLGLGPDAYRFLSPKLIGLHPHSVVVQSLAEWGVLGAAAFGALLLHVLWVGAVRLKAESNPKRRAGRAVALAYLLAACGHALIDGLYYHAHPLLMIAVAAAFVLQPVAPDHDYEETRRGGRFVRLGLVALSLVFVAHLSIAALAAREAPAPDSLRARAVQTFPSSTVGTSDWVRAWSRTDRAAALELARWGRTHSAEPAAFMALEVDLLFAAGDSAAAAAVWEERERLVAASYPHVLYPVE